MTDFDIRKSPSRSSAAGSAISRHTSTATWTITLKFLKP